MDVRGEIEVFLKDEKKKVLTFSPHIKKAERVMIHQIANDLGLFTWSEGEGDSRYAVVSKERNPEDLLEARKSFCKDHAMPIPVLESPYFEYFIELYDTLLESKKKLEWLQIVYEKETNLRQYTLHLQDKILSGIKNNPNYLSFTQITEKQYPVDKKPTVPTSIYSIENDGKYLISIDLKSANFTSMRYVNEAIFDKCTTWYDFISKYTPYEYYRNSKQMRQFLFGNLNSKKINMVISYLLHQIYKQIAKNCNVFTMSHDEIIIQMEKGNLPKQLESLSQALQKYNTMVRLEPFKLVCLDKRKNFWVKEVFKNPNDLSAISPSFKCVGNAYFAMAYKKYFKLEEVPNDRKFTFDGQLASFERSVFS
eukprot:TRINITY_DN23380_c0_g1_i1.p1 TRINITY_DN23380_c0_g1~~TRINITY_DN23380_c0_g1_i1.p1  ORF type:complete len:366 (-),score=106.21 TRINITY_DN23380_c0_g1_i1:237-1334(-)